MKVFYSQMKKDEIEKIKFFYPNTNIDSFEKQLIFYYDETNNIRKLRLKNKKWNVQNIKSINFIIGGIVSEDYINISLEEIINLLKLPKNLKEIKLQNLEKGDFTDILKSKRVNEFLNFIFNKNFYLHYFSVNLLYWSIVDIVDSILESLDNKELFNWHLELKNELYNLVLNNLDIVTNIFIKYDYPNINKYKYNFIQAFIELANNSNNELLKMFLNSYQDDNELIFITDEKSHILLDDFSIFYRDKMILFQNSKHIFDNEVLIKEIFERMGDCKIITCEFIDSKTNILIQISDILVGIIGKMYDFISINSQDEIINILNKMDIVSLQNLSLIKKLIKKTEKNNIHFIKVFQPIINLEKTQLLFEYKNLSNTGHMND